MPTQTALAEALQQGGPILLDFDGIIRLTNTILVNRDAQLIASGRSVALAGNGTHGIFAVEGAGLTVSNLSFINGSFQGADAIAATNNSRQAAEPGRGGAIRINRGRLDLIDCTFSNNVAHGGAPAVFSFYWSPDFVLESGAGAFGGAIYSEDSFVMIRNCRFEGNRAVGSMPLLYPNGGASYFSTSPGVALGGAIFATNSFLTVLNSSFNGGQAAAFDSGDRGTSGGMLGGAIAAENCFTLLSDNSFTGNSAANTNRGGSAFGGAGYFHGGTLELERCLFLSNSAAAGSFSDAAGGALWLDVPTVVESCSLVENNALAGPSGTVGNGSAPGGTARGGAIAAFGGLVLSNSTLAFNQAAASSNRFGGGPIFGAAYGGAVYSGNDISVGFSTIVTNQVFPPMASQLELGPAAAGGIFATNGSLSAVGNIFSGNSRTNLIGDVIDYGGNINSDDGTNGTDPRIGPMRTLFDRFYFFPPLSGSPVIDRLRNRSGPRDDELGFPREFFKSDSGAIEWQGESPKLELVREGGGLTLRLYDPAYAFRKIQVSHDLLTWSPLPFLYEQSISLSDRYSIFKVDF